MERKSGLGFGFFNRTKIKAFSQKESEKSERQIADLYNQVAIRGSIKHVWGDDTQRSLATTKAQSGRLSEVGLATELPVYDTSVPDIGKDYLGSHPDTPEARTDFPSLYAQPGVAQHGAILPYSPEASTDMTHEIRRCLSRRVSLDSGIYPAASIHKKFSFSPSTISLMSSSPSLRTSGKSSYPVTSPSTLRSLSTGCPQPEYRRDPVDDHISIADEVELDERYTAQQISRTTSLHYSSSVTSGVSYNLDSSMPNKQEESALPGSIYANLLPEALRHHSATNALPNHFDEEDDVSSISGLSEVNADNSDSDFESVLNHEEISHEDSLITTAISSSLRRDSAKRVSYTKLDSGDYLVAHQRRSKTPRNSDSSDAVVERSRSMDSRTSGWSTDREYISGGI